MTAFRVQPTVHARHQGMARFPGERIDYEAEVNEALAAGRMSARKPCGLAGPSHAKSLYVWTADRRRVYAATAEDDGRWVITTIMRPTPEQLERAA